MWSVTYSADGRFVGSGSRDNTVRLWNAATGTVIARLEGHTMGVKSVAFTPDGQSIVSGCYDETIRVWDLRNATSSGDEASALTWGSATVDDGWLKGRSSELLAWIPAKYREYVPDPPCKLIIRSGPTVVIRVGNDGWHHGEDWTSCWSKDQSTPVPQST